MKIYIQGYESYEEWARLGFPGAVSFPPERKPDPLRGICEWDKTNCRNKALPGTRYCRGHLDVIHELGFEDIRLMKECNRRASA